MPLARKAAAHRQPAQWGELHDKRRPRPRLLARVRLARPPAAQYTRPAQQISEHRHAQRKAAPSARLVDKHRRSPIGSHYSTQARQLTDTPRPRTSDHAHRIDASGLVCAHRSNQHAIVPCSALMQRPSAPLPPNVASKSGSAARTRHRWRPAPKRRLALSLTYGRARVAPRARRAARINGRRVEASYLLVDLAIHASYVTHDVPHVGDSVPARRARRDR